MKVTEFELPGLKLIEPKRFGDARGWFAEVWQDARYRAAGIAETFVQDNLARSVKGVLRGLHAQEPHAQGKLVQVFAGSVFDVAVDLRVGSPTFRRWEGVILDGDKGLQFYVPPGFLHGYYVLSEQALFGYKTTDVYSPQSEFAVRWDDPDIGIAWPLDGEPALSDKDRSAPLLADIPASRMSRY
ncbi:MAG: dTDP-4-dehydrorhamnose 3,5-epimerase [Chromatiaceae bacterium]|nr:dTDP-4-dehydrorhamnose 3,5-epimerase [Chromatiaceae bacterium]MCP5315372.1 dTDP-4-dehydrorhamnose 3,5-epimerase [Chromatiaceae bacterium]